MYTRIFLYCLLISCWLLEVISTEVSLGLGLISYLVTGGNYTLYLIYHTAWRDFRGAMRYLRILLFVFKRQKFNITVPAAFQNTAKRHPDRVALYFEDQSWTFKKGGTGQWSVSLFVGLTNLEIIMNNDWWFRQNELPDPISIVMYDGRPEYVGTWIGCCKIGVVPALINFNLRGRSLIHSISAASSAAVIYGSELTSAMNEVSSELGSIRLYSSGPQSSTNQKPQFHCCDLDRELLNFSTEDVPTSVKKMLTFTDKLLYIYTSGTTGLPKAAVVKNSRFYLYCCGVYYMNAMYKLEKLVFYDPLPLYHSAGGVVGIGLMMCFGATVVIRDQYLKFNFIQPIFLSGQKFSVRNFWKDCIKYDCNGAQYIGEICRYLLSVPESPEERNHKVQIMFGNGLRPQIWQQFVDRFGVKCIGEFYGATEGNSNVLNIESKPGSVGFTSVLLPFVYPVSLIRIDEEGCPIRDENGLCIKCEPGEPGEFVGKIVKGHPSRGFDGYVDKKATEKKIVHNVLRKGDMYFRSGDLLYMDEFGWMYFVDRMGDTFRWRGENVSTVEVESVISQVLEQTDSVVYGVDIPGVEGKAGMAAIVEDVAKFDLDKFLSRLKAELPTYAIPLFIRLVGTLDLTGTFKFRKLDLVREGYDPSKIQDPLFFYNAAVGTYCKLDSCLYDDIMSRRYRL